MLKQMSEGVDFFEEKDVKNVLMLYAVTVHADYNGKGIGSILIKVSEELYCTLHGLQLFVLFFLSFVNRSSSSSLNLVGLNSVF